MTHINTLTSRNIIYKKILNSLKESYEKKIYEIEIEYKKGKAFLTIDELNEKEIMKAVSKRLKTTEFIVKNIKILDKINKSGFKEYLKTSYIEF